MKVVSKCLSEVRRSGVAGNGANHLGRLCFCCNTDIEIFILISSRKSLLLNEVEISIDDDV